MLTAEMVKNITELNESLLPVLMKQLNSLGIYPTLKPSYVHIRKYTGNNLLCNALKQITFKGIIFRWPYDGSYVTIIPLASNKVILKLVELEYAVGINPFELEIFTNELHDWDSQLLSEIKDEWDEQSITREKELDRFEILWNELLGDLVSKGIDVKKGKPKKGDLFKLLFARSVHSSREYSIRTTDFILYALVKKTATSSGHATYYNSFEDALHHLKKELEA